MLTPRQTFGLFVLVPLLSISIATSAPAQTRDIAGARDYPGIGRLDGSVISGYVTKDFDACDINPS
jgi:OmpA-OmpF porin, OOP family